jgi:hypothetical protein
MSYRAAFSASAVAALCLSLVACGSDAPATAPTPNTPTPNTRSPVASVTVALSAMQVTAGIAFTATVTLRDAAGQPLEQRAVHREYE